MFRQKLLRALFVCTMLFLFQSIYSQDKVVTGKVTDPTGSGINGVSVSAKGTTAATQTGADGSFSLTVGPSVTTLVFTSVGFVSQEVLIDNRSSVNVSLAINNSALGEVVVVAYGTRRRGDLTGSVTSIGTKDFQKGNIASSEQLLLGKVAGLQITSGGGSAGGGSKIRIRTGASLNASNDPLIVIDGVPVDGNKVSGNENLLSTINPDDIESISVLKDASATALYGSRASNGVLIITTKKGTPGKLRYNFNSQSSLSNLADKVDVMTGDQIRSVVTADAIATGNNAYKNLLGTQNTDWQDQIYQLAFGNITNFSINGGTRNLPIRASIGYNGQQGILKTNKFDRYSASLNLSPKLLNDHLTINLAARLSQTNNVFANEGAIGSAVSFDPTQPVYGSKYGGFFEWLQADGKPIDLAARNPLALLELRDNKSRVRRIIGNVQLDYKLHFLPDLHILANIGLDRSWGRGNDNTDSLAATDYKTGGKRVFYKQGKENDLIDFSLFYTKEIKSIRSKFDVLATHSYQSMFTNVYNFPEFSYRGANDTIPNSMEANLTDKPGYRLESYLGRINYTYADKYLITASIRRDATSRFSGPTRIGYYPAAAFAWKIKEEDFLSNTAFVNDLKLRLGWGITGQQGLRDPNGDELFYPYLPRYSRSNSSAQYQFGNTFVGFLRPFAYDENIKWETTTTYNIGLDFAFLNSRISGSIDVYKKNTKDLMSIIPVAPGSNFDISLFTNVGNMENKGVEFVINTTPVRTSTFTWDFGFNVTYSTTEIINLLKYPDPNFKGIPVSPINGGTGNKIGRFAIGEAPYTFFVYKQVYDAQSGKPIEGLYEDITRDGKVDEADRYLYKKPSPDALLGINTQLTYQKWSFSLAAHGMFGNYLYNNYNSNSGVIRAIKNPLSFIGNASSDYFESTQFTNNQYFSDYYIENASFLRLDNINFGYNAGKIFGNTTNTRITANVQNAFVITKYKGLDPENSSDTGVDNNIYPRPRVFTLGVNVDF
jgi:TonB-linked SusC/RagA family outer membrane protein